MSTHHIDWQALHYQTAGGSSQVRQLSIRMLIISRQITRLRQGKVQDSYNTVGFDVIHTLKRAKAALAGLALPSIIARNLLQVNYCLRFSHRINLPVERRFFASFPW